VRGLLTRWIAVRESFWLVPATVVVGLGVLALVLARIDRRLAFEAELDLVFGGDASAARDLLAAVAGSLATVGGVTLSLAVVTFQLVAGQYSPRAVRTLVQDRMIQLTAGVFVGVVAYCLLVLRVVRSAEEDGSGEFVPRLSVSGSIALALAALMLLVVFIHHLAGTIRVENIAAHVARETLSALDALYPDRVGAAADSPDEPDAAGAVACASRPGFVQTISVDDFARGLPAGSRLELHVAPGDFVTERVPLATLRPAPDDAGRFEDAIRAGVGITSERTMEQDAEYGVRQLADVALRAISPSLNDPTTAVTCVGYIRACVERLATRALPARERAVGEATVIARRRRFDEYVEPLVEISRYAREDARVTVALLEAVGAGAAAAASVGATTRVVTLRAVADAIADPALDAARTEHDRALIEDARRLVAQQQV
jgi:uncharacterized membrane protein